MTKLDDVKEHLARNKAKYLFVGGCVVGAAAAGFVTVAVVNGRVDEGVLARAQNIALINWKTSAENHVKLTRRMHPGYTILVVESGEKYASIRRTAEALGISPRDISQQLKGFKPNVNGYTFKNLGETAA